MELTIEGSTREVEPVIRRARRAGRQVAVVRLASGRVRVTVGRAPGAGDVPPAPTSTALVPVEASGGPPLWVPIVIASTGAGLVLALVVMAGVWAHGHPEAALVLGLAALLIASKVLATRLNRS